MAAMEQDAVRVEKQGAVTVVTLQRPEVRNAVDGATARRLHAAFLAFEDDAEARVAVFHGAHGHFCAGWDLQAGARLAQQLCGFPQETMRADRLNAYEQWDRPLAQALHGEWERSRARIPDALQGAARFAAGEGRHGKF